MGDRPPTDDPFSEIIFDRKCATKPDDHNKFYRWCMFEANAGSSQDTTATCTGLGGGLGTCTLKARLSSKPNPFARYLAQGVEYVRYIRQEIETTTITSSPSDTTNVTKSNISTTTPIPNDNTDRVRYFYWQRECEAGGNKPTEKSSGYKELTYEEADKLVRFCEQEIYGSPFGLPLWLLILIIMLVMTAVAVSAFFFWRSYTRRMDPDRTASGSFRGNSRMRSGLSSQATARSNLPSSVQRSSRASSGVGSSRASTVRSQQYGSGAASRAAASNLSRGTAASSASEANPHSSASALRRSTVATTATDDYDNQAGSSRASRSGGRSSSSRAPRGAGSRPS